MAAQLTANLSICLSNCLYTHATGIVIAIAIAIARIKLYRKFNPFNRRVMPLNFSGRRRRVVNLMLWSLYPS